MPLDQPCTYTHVVGTLWTTLHDQKLSFGTCVTQEESASIKNLRPLNLPFSRKQLIEDAKLFLGAPYLWGGAAALRRNPVSSVDCSGLIYLLYRTQGILLPRDAHPQSLKGSKKDFHELELGDLIYLSHETNPTKQTHVLLFNGNTYIESPKTGECVQELPFHTHYKIIGPYVEIHGREGKYLPTYISYV